MLVRHMNVGPDVDAAGLDAAGILRQPADTMAIRSLQVGLGHQPGDCHCVVVRQAQPGQRLMNECLQSVKGDGQSWLHWCPLPEVRDPLGAPTFANFGE